MNVSDSIARLTEYYRRHGWAVTVRRVGVAVKRLSAGRMVVFYCKPVKRDGDHVVVANALRVERARAMAEVSAEHLQAMTSVWNPKLAIRNISERFERGASLWLVECDGKLAGYGWTLKGCTIEPYYFPLAQDDIHLFDFYVFSDFRGRGINPFLVGHILDALASSCSGRAFIEAAEWNHAQLSSLSKTAFRRLGSVRSITIFGHTFVSWMRSDVAVEVCESVQPRDQFLAR